MSQYSLSSFSAESAIDLWWNHCSSGRQNNQKPRKKYCQRQSLCLQDDDEKEKSDSDSEAEICLKSWDDWFGKDNNDSC